MGNLVAALFELFVVRWMDLESVIQSEVSQKEKNKYRMLTHMYGILKNGTHELSGRAGIKTQDTVGKGKLEGSERVALTYIHQQM